MAYKLKREATVTELLELENGEIITLELNIPTIAKDFALKCNAIQRLKIDEADINPENIEEYYNQLGHTLTELMQLVMGTENTIKVSEYYENNYIDMCNNIMGFITEVVKPHIEKYAKDKQEKAKSEYLNNKRKARNI